MQKIKISPEYSAQASVFQPNPFVQKAIEAIEPYINGRQRRTLQVADQGCGKLRHLGILREHFKFLLLIDTQHQLTRKQRLFGIDNISVEEYVRRHSDNGRIVTVDAKQFESSELDLDIIFNVCVFDVVTPEIRITIIEAALKNLKTTGLYVVVIPRNDRSILRRCCKENEYLDGHVFDHHGVRTFFKNFDDTNDIVNSCSKRGFTLLHDFTVHRQVGLVLQKN
jgi:hypothetical protein